MDTKEVIYNLRMQKGMSQEELAEKIMVTRQAVSRWENGETVPNTDTLKLLSKEFNVTINTLLGAPKQLICQCCGMPLEDKVVGHDGDGFLNEDYCMWCYADGNFTYSNMDDLISVCIPHMVSQGFSEEQALAHMKATLPTLEYWKKHDELGDEGEYEMLKAQLVEEINGLHIQGMPKVEKLNALVGSYVNLPYPLPSGASVKFLDDQTTYMGCQLESESAQGKYFGVLANADIIVVSTYEEEGKNPELLLYKKR